MMWCITNMTTHTVRLDIITTIDQHRRDTITIIITDRRHLRVIMGHITIIRIMVIAISRSDHLISIAPIAISRSDHLHRSVIMGHLIMGHLTSIAHLLTEVVDKKCNEIKKIIIISQKNHQKIWWFHFFIVSLYQEKKLITNLITNT